MRFYLDYLIEQRDKPYYRFNSRGKILLVDANEYDKILKWGTTPHQRNVITNYLQDGIKSALRSKRNSGTITLDV